MGNEGDFFMRRYGQLIDIVNVLDNMKELRIYIPGSAYDFFMAFVSDKDNVNIFFGVQDGFVMDFGDQRARGIDHPKPAGACFRN